MSYVALKGQALRKGMTVAFDTIGLVLKIKIIFKARRNADCNEDIVTNISHQCLLTLETYSRAKNLNRKTHLRSVVF